MLLLGCEWSASEIQRRSFCGVHMTGICTTKIERQISLSSGSKMYEESGCFDPNAMMAQGTEDCFPQIVMPATVTNSITETHKNNNTFAKNEGLSLENLPYHPYSSGEYAPIATSMEIIPHPQQNYYPYNTQLVVEDFNNNNNNNNKNSNDVSNHQFPYPTPTPPDLLNLLHLPRRPPSPFGNSSVSFENPTTNLPPPPPYTTNLSPSSLSYDPFLHLNLQAPHQAALRELQIPHGYPMPPSRNDFAFDIQGSGVAYHDGDERDFENGVLEFAEDVSYGGKKRGGKRAKQFTSTTERQRRVDLSGKFDALKELIPNPSKSDRASVVGDAIDYIRELLRTLNELKLLAEKKRNEKQRMIKRHKVENEDELKKLDAIGDDSYLESLRSSWIQRKSKDTEVDVRIVDNEVTIKLVQRKKINCLVHAAQALDELKLDLHHVAGGHIGDFCSFLFNSKICEGSSVYASAIANKLIEVMDRTLAAP
ncbi:hypothetical protein VNO77_02745 [Canavalia gladiata]|uniref:BHLH domain-containing protein n=1 Tax=Canavalia gladiata TaxID=3824 RepID=A0AAN9MUB4_CANGL